LRSDMTKQKSFRLVSGGWRQEMAHALCEEFSELRIVTPFIKRGALALLDIPKLNSIRVITRYSLADFYQGVSDICALDALLENGAEVRGIQDLHSKLYLFGTRRATITSANLTESALEKNHEFGLVTEDQRVIRECSQYFEWLWGEGQTNLTTSDLRTWEIDVNRYRNQIGPPASKASLKDHGVAVKAERSPAFVGPMIWAASAHPSAQQAYVKLFGMSRKRCPLTQRIEERVEWEGCHRFLSYPEKFPPNNVNQGDTVFIAYQTGKPKDIRVFGRAIAVGSRKATVAELNRRDYKREWCQYLDVCDAEFLAGTMANGVSLYEMIDELKADSFVTTQSSAKQGKKDINAKLSYRSGSALLSDKGQAWLDERLRAAFQRHGKISQNVLDQIG